MQVFFVRRNGISFQNGRFTCRRNLTGGRWASVYTELSLKLLTGRTTQIRVDPPFDVDDLEYLPGIRAVTLGNLVVLYEGLVYDVRPSGRIG